LAGGSHQAAFGRINPLFGAMYALQPAHSKHGLMDFPPQIVLTVTVCSNCSGTIKVAEGARGSGCSRRPYLRDRVQGVSKQIEGFHLNQEFP